MYGRGLLLSLDCSTLLLIRTLMVWVFANVRPCFNPRSNHTKDLKKLHLMPLCLTLSIIRYGSRVKWSNPGKTVTLSLAVVAIEKSLRVTHDYGQQLYLLVPNKSPSQLWLKNTPTAFLQRGKTLISFLYMTLNNLMVRFQWCWVH